jgi:ankyrin repeat protein
MSASREGSLAAAELLVAAGADVNVATPDGLTALLIATVRGHWEQAVFLLESGAEPEVASTGYCPLHWAAGSWETSWNGVRGVTASYTQGQNALEPAEKLALVRALLAHGADPNARVVTQPPRFGFSLFRHNLVDATPFFLAAMAGDVGVMRLLADAGADPLLATSSGTTPLMAAAGIGWIESESLVTEADSLAAVTLAARLGGDVNASNEVGETALHGAAAKGADSIVQFLADSGAAIDVENDRGDTPLRIAEGKGARFAGGQGLKVQESTANLLRRLAADPSR